MANFKSTTGLMEFRRLSSKTNTGAMVSEDWHDLRVGDRIRFTAMPTGF
jgi:hypothetical protein